MGRHRSSPASTKHKSKSSSHEKHKKQKPTSTKTSTRSNSLKPKRVSFGGVSSDNGPSAHSSSSSSSSSSTHHPQHHSKSKSKNPTGEEHTTAKPHKPHSLTKTKERGSAKGQLSNGNGKGYKSYSSTSGIIKSREKHPKRSVPSHSHKIAPHTTSSSIPTPTQRKPKPSLKKPTSSLKNPANTTKKPTKECSPAPSPPPPPPQHPYATLFSDFLHQKTTRLFTHLSAQLNSILTTILQSLPQINISPSTNEPYTTLAAAHKTAILAKYGKAMPLGVIRKFQADCREWDRELKGLLLEHEGAQKELVELAREIGIVGGGVDGGGGAAGKKDEEDVEFEEMIKEIKQIGQTYMAKMDKLEKQIFQEEARQNMLIMQAM